MGDFVWTFVVASVAFLAGYIMCSLLIGERIRNVKRVAVRYHMKVQAVQNVLDEGRKDRGWGHDDDYDAGWDRCANDVEYALRNGDA